MRTPSSRLRALKPHLRHPSPALVVAGVALFMSLGGASYAAVSLGKNSVHTVNIHPYAITNGKIANKAVNFRKIKPNSVGRVRIVKNAVQLRVTGTCTTPDQAMTSINVNGGVTCASSAPSEYDTHAGAQQTLGANNVTLASLQLAGGSAYMVQAQPYIEVTSGAKDTNPQVVDVTCTLAAGPATTATITRTTSVSLDAANETKFASLPLTVTAPAGPNSIAAPVFCSEKLSSGTGSPVVKAQATVFATTIYQPPAKAPAPAPAPAPAS